MLTTKKVKLGICIIVYSFINFSGNTNNLIQYFLNKLELEMVIEKKYFHVIKTMRFIFYRNKYIV